ncbi:TVP38/TMEM64 family protein [Desulfolithobacter sp.]
MQRTTVYKITLSVTVLVLLGLFYLLELNQHLTLDTLKARQGELSALVARHRGIMIITYMITYIVIIGLSLPGAVVLTLAGGAMFGLVTGTIVVSFASTIGATLACLAARYLLRDWVRSRFRDRLRTINKGMAREGALYLFSLRLVPVFPFFLINLAMGLTSIRLTTFYLVSQLGMLPATIVYVNAGRQLARIQSPADVLSPGLLISFALLGLLPLAARKLLDLYRRSRRPS